MRPAPLSLQSWERNTSSKSEKSSRPVDKESHSPDCHAESPRSPFKSSICQVSSRKRAKTCHLLICGARCHSAPCYWHVVCNLEEINAICHGILEKIPPTDFSKFCWLTTQNTSELYNHIFFPIQDFNKYSSCGSQLSTMYFIFKTTSFLIPRSVAVLSLGDLSWITPYRASSLPRVLLSSSPLRLVDESDNPYSIQPPPLHLCWVRKLTIRVRHRTIKPERQKWSSYPHKNGSRQGQPKGKKSPRFGWNGSCLPQGTDTATRPAVLSSEIPPWYVSWQRYNIRKVTDGWLDWV